MWPRAGHQFFYVRDYRSRTHQYTESIGNNGDKYHKGAMLTLAESILLPYQVGQDIFTPQEH